MFKIRLFLWTFVLLSLLLLAGYLVVNLSQAPEYPSRVVFNQIRKGMTRQQIELVVGRPATGLSDGASHFQGGWRMEDGCRIEFEMDRSNGTLTWKRLNEPRQPTLGQRLRALLGL